MPSPAATDSPLTRARTPVRWLALSIVLLVTIAVYLRAAFFEFAYDDFGQIVYNPQIKSWPLAFTYFKSHVWAHSSGIALYYRPIYMLWLAASYKLFGLTPSYWHLAVIVLHLLCCILLYFFILRLTQDQWVTAVASSSVRPTSGARGKRGVDLWRYRISYGLTISWIPALLPEKTRFRED